jgi:hypothetical protein
MALQLRQVLLCVRPCGVLGHSWLASMAGIHGRHSWVTVLLTAVLLTPRGIFSKSSWMRIHVHGNGVHALAAMFMVTAFMLGWHGIGRRCT